jgi:hypothetical protein
MKRKVYLFNNKASIAANYGIGKYIEQVVILVRNTNISLTVIELYSQQTKEVIITRENFGDRITVPSNSMGTYILTETSGHRYTRNVVYLLKEYIPDDEEILFHLNYMGNEYLAIELKNNSRLKFC